jgi:hypothetical protein
VVAVIVGILGIVPLLNLIIMLIYNQRATSILRRHGVVVGFLGIRKEDWHKLVGGSCPACGYDVRGLPQGVCPECGGVLRPEHVGAPSVEAPGAPNDPR